MNPISLTDEAQSRAASYQLLSALYYPPDDSLGDNLHALAEVWGVSQPDLLPLVARMQQEADPHALLLAYTPLFLGPFKVLASPYGSVYLDGKREMMGASTQEVARLYRQAGLDMSATSKEVPDHIAIELEFMYYLLYSQMEALERDDSETAHNWLARQIDFLDRHLGRWIDPFASAIVKNTSSLFYRSLAEATAAFVTQHRQALAE